MTIELGDQDWDDAIAGPPYEPSDSEIAESFMACPWYLGTGICDRGCQSEPACQTMEPVGGWASQIETRPTLGSESLVGPVENVELP